MIEDGVKRVWPVMLPNYSPIPQDHHKNRLGLV